MTMTPIHRIPLGDDTLALTVSRELDSLGEYSFAFEMKETLRHSDDESANTIMMDWAMQIRMELGISWGECIRAASILFYG